MTFIQPRGVILSRVSFRQLLRADNLYRWHKPSEGLLMLGKNKEYSREFCKLALRPAFEEGVFSFLTIGEDSYDFMEMEDSHTSNISLIKLEEISHLSFSDLYELIDRKLNSRPLSLILLLPTYERTFYSPDDRAIIRKVIQQVIMWLESNMNLTALDKDYSGVFYLEHPEKYISKEQTGLINQINLLKRKNYCTGFHFYGVPRSVDMNAGILSLFEDQSFVLMLNETLKRNTGLFNLFRNKPVEDGCKLTKLLSYLLPCPRTLILKEAL